MFLQKFQAQCYLFVFAHVGDGRALKVEQETTPSGQLTRQEVSSGMQADCQSAFSCPRLKNAPWLPRTVPLRYNAPRRKACRNIDINFRPRTPSPRYLHSTQVVELHVQHAVWPASTRARGGRGAAKPLWGKSSSSRHQLHISRKLTIVSATATASERLQ